MKVISYSLFGFNKERQDNCFDFNSYLRGLMINIRMNRLIFPDFQTWVYLDKSTYDGFKNLFDKLPIRFFICDEAPLCLAMLWRMKPCFDSSVEVVLCRDTDSPATYKEAQLVKYWMNKDKVAHAITDSVSHSLPMLGGMIGFKPKHFKDYTALDRWEALVESRGIDYSKKGSDQDLLNSHVYPCFAKHGSDSITQHYLLGMPNTFLSDYHNEVPNMDLDISFEMKESNDTCGHIGAAGYYTTAMHKFLYKHRDRFEDIRNAEKEYSDIFYWLKDNSF